MERKNCTFFKLFILVLSTLLGVGVSSAIGINDLTDSRSDQTNLLSLGKGSSANSTMNGIEVTSVGIDSARNNTRSGVTVIGIRSGENNTEYGAVLVGSQSGRNNTGLDAVGVGNDALMDNSGTHSTAVGDDAGKYNQGGYLSALGANAGEHNAGQSLTTFGINAGRNNSGNYSVSVGGNAGESNSGQNSVLIGYNAGKNNIYSNVVVLGANVEATKSNQVMLGNSSTTEVMSAGSYFSERYTSVGGWGASFHGRKVRGTNGSPMPNSNNDVLTGLYGGGYSGTANTGWVAAIRFLASENYGSGKNGSKIDFATTSNGASSRTTKMVILQNGRVGIGTTAPTELLSVNGNANKIGTGSWGVFSDERLKNVERNFTRGLDALVNLNPVVYRYKENNPLEISSKKSYVGILAQQAEKKIPESVSYTEGGYLLLNNDPIFWTMLNSIKELRVNQIKKDREIEILKRELESLVELTRELRN